MTRPSFRPLDPCFASKSKLDWPSPKLSRPQSLDIAQNISNRRALFFARSSRCDWNVYPEKHRGQKLKSKDCLKSLMMWRIPSNTPNRRELSAKTQAMRELRCALPWPHLYKSWQHFFGCQSWRKLKFPRKWWLYCRVTRLSFGKK